MSGRAKGTAGGTTSVAGVRGDLGAFTVLLVFSASVDSYPRAASIVSRAPCAFARIASEVRGELVEICVWFLPAALRGFRPWLLLCAPFGMGSTCDDQGEGAYVVASMR